MLGAFGERLKFIGGYVGKSLSFADLFMTLVIATAVFLGLSLLLGFFTAWAIGYIFAPSVVLAVFGATKVTFWQGFVLNMLSGVLFKSGTSSSSKKS